MLVVVVVLVVGVTTIGAVSPVGTIVNASAVAGALFVYVPAFADTMTPKCSVSVPAVPPLSAGTVSGPVQVSN